MMSVRQISDAVAIRHFSRDRLRLIDAEYRGRYLYVYFLGAAGGEDQPAPKYFLAQTMELDCVTEDGARKNMKKLMDAQHHLSP